MQAGATMANSDNESSSRSDEELGENYNEANEQCVPHIMAIFDEESDCNSSFDGFV